MEQIQVYGFAIFFETLDRLGKILEQKGSSLTAKDLPDLFAKGYDNPQDMKHVILDSLTEIAGEEEAQDIFPDILFVESVFDNTFAGSHVEEDSQIEQQAEKEFIYQLWQNNFSQSDGVSRQLINWDYEPSDEEELEV